jgi:hypothetical protein
MGGVAVADARRWPARCGSLAAHSCLALIERGACGALGLIALHARDVEHLTERKQPRFEGIGAEHAVVLGVAVWCERRARARARARGASRAHQIEARQAGADVAIAVAVTEPEADRRGRRSRRTLAAEKTRGAIIGAFRGARAGFERPLRSGDGDARVASSATVRSEGHAAFARRAVLLDDVAGRRRLRYSRAIASTWKVVRWIAPADFACARAALSGGTVRIQRALVADVELALQLAGTRIQGIAHEAAEVIVALRFS